MRKDLKKQNKRSFIRSCLIRGAINSCPLIQYRTILILPIYRLLDSILLIYWNDCKLFIQLSEVRGDGQCKHNCPVKAGSHLYNFYYDPIFFLLTDAIVWMVMNVLGICAFSWTSVTYLLARLHLSKEENEEHYYFCVSFFFGVKWYDMTNCLL